MIEELEEAATQFAEEATVVIGEVIEAVLEDGVVTEEETAGLQEVFDAAGLNEEESAALHTIVGEAE